MRQIREGVFETNSSSVHTITFSQEGLEPSRLPIDPITNKVIGRFGKFGRDVNCYDSQEDKLAYMLTCCAYNVGEDDRIYDHWLFEEVEKIIKEYCHCDGLEIDFSSRAYLDHQSIPEYDFDLFYPEPENIKNFIFNKNIRLTTCSD